MSATWSRALERLDATGRSAGTLARLASLAVRVEPRLLRRLRLRFLHGVGPEAEADLWFSALVAARDPGGLTWAPGAAEVLRAALADVHEIDPAEVRDEIATAHATASPLLQLEEEVVWLSVRGAPRTEIEAALGRAVRSLQDQPAHAADLAAWAVHALPGLPEGARTTAAAWQLRLAAASRFGVEAAMGVPAPDDLLAHVARGVLIDRGREHVRVVRDAAGLWLEAAPDATDGDPETVAVPRTRPLWLEVSSDHGRRRAVVSVEPGKRTALDAADGDVLRNALGDAWIIEAAHTARIAASPDTDAGEVLLGWAVVRIPPSDPAAWQRVREQVLADLARSATRIGRVDEVILLATDVPLKYRSALEVIGDEIRDAVSPSKAAIRLIVGPTAAQQTSTPSERQARVVNQRLPKRVHIIMRTDDASDEWPEFRSQVMTAMDEGSRSGNDLVVAIGRDACRLAERRFQPGAPPLLILDDATPWAPPPPGHRIAGPSAFLWSTDDGPPAATYTLGCVRGLAQLTEDSPATALVASVDRTLRDGQWRERTGVPSELELRYRGDESYGWAARDAAIVIGDTGGDRFAPALRGWFEDGGAMEPRRFMVWDPRGRRSIHELMDDLLRDRPARVWLFARSGADATAVGILWSKLTGAGQSELAGFFDRHELVRMPVMHGPTWMVAPPIGETERGALPVTSAVLEALLASPARSFDQIEHHLTVRCGGRPEFVALMPHPLPARKHLRLDTSALRRVSGGRRDDDAVVGSDDVRVVFVSGRDSLERSAWLDRWLARILASADMTTAGTILGWTPSLHGSDALLAHARAVLVDWASPPLPLDGPEELAWRIEGAIAVLVLDTLGLEATDFERRLIEACCRRRAGRIVVSTPHVVGWMKELPNTQVIDLAQQAEPAELIAHRRRAFEPTVAEWVERLATWGHDQPVLAAIQLSDTAVSVVRARPPFVHAALHSWLRTGDPRPLVHEPEAGPSVVGFAADAALALCDGDPDRMLACVRHAIEHAIAMLGAATCARVFGAAAAEPDEPAIQIAETGDRYQLTGRSGAGEKFQATVNAATVARPQDSSLHALAPLVIASTSSPVALYLSPGKAHEIPWELVLAQASSESDAPHDLQRRMLVFRTVGRLARPIEILPSSRPNLVSFVGTESDADAVRAAFRDRAAAGATFDVRVNWSRPKLERDDTWCLHLLGSPEVSESGGASLQLKSKFSELGGISTRIDRRPDRWIDLDELSKLDPAVLILQDLPTTTLAHSLQARERGKRLRVFAARLAQHIPVVVVIPAVEHDQAPPILHLLFEALAAPQIPRALLAAVGRARGLILDRSRGNAAAAAAIAGDLVLWARHVRGGR